MICILECFLCLVLMVSLLVLIFLLSSEMTSVQICDVGVGVPLYMYWFVFIIHLWIYLDSYWKLSLHTLLLVATYTVLPLDIPSMNLLFHSFLCCHLSYPGKQWLVCYKDQKNRRLCWDQGGARPLYGGEGGRLAGFGIRLVWGGALSPSDRICRPAGVGLCETRHPGHRYGLPGGRWCAAVHLSPSPILGGHGTDSLEGYHWSDGQTIQ